jgi:hypothetical protein
MSTLPPLVLTDAERAELRRRVRAQTTRNATPLAPRSCCWPLRACQPADRPAARHAPRPREQLAPPVHSRTAGLADRPTSLEPPPVYSHDERLRLIATITQTPPDPASHWTHSQLTDALANIGISASQIGRILADLDIKPHRVRGWITRGEVPQSWTMARRTSRWRPAGGSPSSNGSTRTTPKLFVVVEPGRGVSRSLLAGS